MKPAVKKIDFEKVKTGEFIPGEIANIQYDLNHKFKGFSGKPDVETEAVRFVFRLEGYEHKHYSRWMKFSYMEKANLYKKYLVKLVEGIQPDADFDLDALKGMRVKTIWKEDNGFQDVEAIFPLEKKIPLDAPVPEPEEIEDLEPF
ncbi:MAG: hypothetical protein ACUVWN_04630 [bacterium]